MLLMLSVLMALSPGCARRVENSQNLEKSHVRSLTILHGLAVAKLGHLPSNEKEFKQAIATISLKPEQMKVGSFDKLFVSERDGKPLVLVYGAQNQNLDVVVYEQNGVNGKRLVGHRIGMVEELDEIQFKTLTASKQ
jgi:hypothetical protein